MVVDRRSIDKVLELANGEWVIVCLCLLAFLIYYLLHVGRAYKLLTVRRVIRLPMGMRLAIGIAVVCVGMISRSAPIWYDRFTHDGVLTSISMMEKALLIGTAISITGFCCIMRVVTRPMLGNWPWMLTLALMTGYWLLWMLE
jgi:hypothetical protein